jgi:DNA-binding beta-propeller fold protein YncE
MKFTLAAAAATLLTAPCFAQGTMYLLDGSSRAVYTLDLATAVKSQVGTINSEVNTVGGLAYDCVSGTMYLSSTTNDMLYRLDLTTFTATLIGAFSADVVMHGIEWDRSTNTLWGGSEGNLYRIDTGTGAATLVGNAGFGSFLNLGYHEARDILYGSNTQTDTLYTIDRATGAGTLIGSLNGPTNPHGFAYVPHLDTMYLVCSSTDTLYTLNLDTGVATPVGALGAGNYLGLAWVPATCALPTFDARVNLSAPARCAG